MTEATDNPRRLRRLANSAFQGLAPVQHPIVPPHKPTPLNLSNAMRRHVPRNAVGVRRMGLRNAVLYPRMLRLVAIG